MSKMKYKPYTKYKDSGVEWIGEIPVGWDIRRLKYVSRFNYGDSLSEENRNDSGEILVYGSNGVVGHHDMAITLGKTIIIGRKGSYGQVNWSSECCFPIDTTFYIDEKTTKHNLRWLYYLLKVLKLDEGSQDSAVPGLGREKAYSHIVTLCEHKEQKQISAFLDQETSHINTTIEKYEKLIELLKEKRIALISHAVTKGLNPDVKMKDSGIEWIGEIPEHWGITKVRAEFDLLDHKRVPLSAEIRGVMQEKRYDYYGASGVIDKVDDYIFDETLILLGEDGANLYARSTPLAFLAHGKYWVNNHAHILRPKRGEIEYFVNLLESIDYVPYITGSAQPKLTGSNLKNISLVAPPIEEQKQIAIYINTEMLQTDQLIEKINKQIELLNEYKTSLISHTVTGKINVRGIV